MWVYPWRVGLLVPVAVDAQNGETPIHVAAMCGHLSVVRLLVRAGASIDARNKARVRAWALPTQGCGPDMTYVTIL